MIHTFDKSNVLWFPKKWANSVANWLLNIRSEDNSIKISNTSEPEEGRGCNLEVNLEAIEDVIVERVIERLELMNEEPDYTEDSEEDHDDNQEGGTGSGKYGVRVGWGTPVEGMNYFIKWIAFGTEAELDTYTGETALSAQQGLYCPTFTSPNVKYILGPFIQGYYSAMPVMTENEVTGVKFGTFYDIMNETNNVTEASIGGNGKYGVKPVYTNGVLTSLDFGTEEDLEQDSYTYRLETTSGCPYGQTIPQS